MLQAGEVGNKGEPNPWMCGLACRGSSRRPPLQYSRSLPDGQVDPRPVLNRLREDIPRLVEAVAGIEQAIDRRSVSRPLLDLIEVVGVRNQRVVSFFVGPIVVGHCS
jgi:hypothetical protein